MAVKKAPAKKVEVATQTIKTAEPIAVKKTPAKQGLEFKNPNVNGECGCGESFTV